MTGAGYSGTMEYEQKSFFPGDCQVLFQKQTEPFYRRMHDVQQDNTCLPPEPRQALGIVLSRCRALSYQA